RSSASARRRSSTARGWPSMDSNATQELPHHGGDVGGDGLDRTRGADQAHALGLGAQDVAIAPPHAAVERELFALEAVVPATSNALETGLRREVEEQREVGQHAACRPQVELANQIGAHA